MFSLTFNYFPRELPQLLTGRRGHACGGYTFEERNVRVLFFNPFCKISWNFSYYEPHQKFPNIVSQICIDFSGLIRIVEFRWWSWQEVMMGHKMLQAPKWWTSQVKTFKVISPRQQSIVDLRTCNLFIYLCPICDQDCQGRWSGGMLVSFHRPEVDLVEPIWPESFMWLVVGIPALQSIPYNPYCCSHWMIRHGRKLRLPPRNSFVGPSVRDLVSIVPISIGLKATCIK